MRRARPATPASFEIEDLLDGLRQATQVEGKAPWRACIVKLDRVSAKVTVDFEYDHPEQWGVTPATAARIAEPARPTVADRRRSITAEAVSCRCS